MSIKQSSLEQKIFYRVAKVVFLILPLLAGAILFLKGYIVIPELFQKNLADISSQEVFDLLQKNSIYIFYVVAGLVAYYLVLKGIWRMVLYIAFGGLEDDTKRKAGEAEQPVNQSVQSAPAKNNSGEIIGWIILIILIIWIAAYTGTSPSPGPGPNPQPTCIPTGCGKLWRSSCTNKCYTNLSDCRQTGSACNGNVTCRQCP